MTYLIDQLAASRRWSCSNDFQADNNWSQTERDSFNKHRKRPLFLGDYINSRNNLLRSMPLDSAVKNSIHLMQDYTDADESKLNSLYELDLPELTTFKRAYRMNALQNLVVVLDVEPDSSPEVIDKFSKLPAHYAEWSTNNGLHLFYKLDLTAISPEIRALLAYTVKKIDTVEHSLRCKFELILNDHWITFTGKTNPSQIVPVENPIPSEIYKILESIAKETLVHQLQLQEIAIDAETTSEESDRVAEWLLGSSKTSEVMQLTPDQFQNDMSKYEFNCIIRIAGYLRYQMDHITPMQAFRLNGINLAQLSDQDAVKAVYLVAKEILPYRDKHSTNRDKMPWLLYTSLKAYEQVLARAKQPNT